MSTRKRLEPIDEPWILRSRRKSKPCSSIFWPNGIMPTMVAVPPGASICERLLGGLLAAQHLEGVMHAALGELAHLLHHVAIAGIDDVGGAELGGQLQLHRIGVDRDDAAGAGDRRAVDRGHADAAAADHRHGLAGADLGRVHRPRRSR